MYNDFLWEWGWEMIVQISSKLKNRADIMSDCRNYLLLKCCLFLFSVIYYRSCQTNTCRKYYHNWFLWLFQKWLTSVFSTFDYGELVWGHYRASRVLLFKCYSSNILYWLQAEMWGKHFAQSIVIIGKWNQARAMYNVQRRGVMRIIKCS